MSTARAVIELLRLHFSATMPLVVPLTIYYARDGQMAGIWLDAWLTTAALSLLMMGAYAVNDVIDVEADRVNMPQRPLPSLRLSRVAAISLAVVLNGAALSVGATVHWRVLAVLTTIGLGLLAYNLTSKRLGVLKQVAVAVLVVSMYPLSLACSGPPHGTRVLTLVVFPIWMLLTAYGFELYKDLRDRRGDEHVGAEPMPWHRRPRKWRRVADVALGTGGAALILPAFVGNTWLYLALVLPAVFVGPVVRRLSLRAAMAAVYLQFILVGIAATADVIFFP